VKVKVRDKIYDGEKEPIMVILTKKDKKIIAAMHQDCNRYWVCPDSKEWTDNNYEKINKWINEV